MKKFYSILTALSLPFMAVCSASAQDADTFTINVSDVTKTSAYVSIVPSNPDRPYVMDVVTAGLVERAGGIDNIYEYHDLAWWLLLAEQAGCDWTEVAPENFNYGEIKADTYELIEGKLKWDTDYVVYAYYVDEECEQCSDVTTATFKTLPAGKSDITFEVSLLNVEPDDTGNYNNVTLHVIPSNDDSYGNHMHEARYYDFYVDNPDFTFNDYLDNQVFPYILSTRTGERVLTYKKVRPGKEYVFVSLGYDETPTSGENVHMFRFISDASGVATTEVAPNAVIGGKGRIYVDGEYDAMVVHNVSGQLAGTYRNVTSVEVPCGIYVVTLRTGSDTTTHKVMVK